MSLTREDLEHDRLRERIRRNFPDYPLLADDVFDASRQAIVDEIDGEDIWIFGYGSLIWNPCIDFDRREPTTLTGLTRRYCLWDKSGRGSADAPGFYLALAPGERCDGVAFHVPADKVEWELTCVWRREMISGSYRAAVLPATTADGQAIRCVVFLANPQHERYCCEVLPQKLVECIAVAEGTIGTSREYLYSTVAGLAKVGLEDPELTALEQAVRQYRAVRGLPDDH
ncbi:MAG: gamma-glutamylcyclotransferase [Pseudomonadota bacterium]